MKALFGDLEGLVRAAEFFALEVFVCKRLGRAHTGQARLNVGVDVAHALLDLPRRLPHLPSSRQRRHKEHRQDDAHDEGQTPFCAEHDDERTYDRDERDKQVLGAVVGKLGDLKKIAREPAHELAGAVFVEIVKAQRLHMAEQRLADIGLDADAEGVAPVGDDEIKKAPEDIGQHHNAHDGEERRIRVFGQQLIHRPARDERVGKIDERHDERTGHVEEKKAQVGLKKVQKNLQHRAFLIVSGGHTF